MMATGLEVRQARPSDLDAITAIDALQGGHPKPEYWHGILKRYTRDDADRVAMVAVDRSGIVAGYLFGEVRAWEFGSERCGWIFAVAIHPAHAREHVGTRLCEASMRRFRDAGVRLVRTMVRRGDVPILAFFRSLGFVAGPFSEMEIAIPEKAPREPEVGAGGVA